FCVEGNVNKTYDYLLSVEEKSDKEQKMIQKYYHRFYKDNPDFKTSHKDPWIENIINVYRHYFVEVLTKTVETPIAEATLLEQLNCHIPIDKNYADMEQTEEHLRAIFREKGYHFQGGRVFPHYGPFIWKTTNQKTYHVDIPNTTEEVE